MTDAILLALIVILAVLTIEAVELMHSVVFFAGMSVAIACLFALLGAPYAALFQVIIYAGAIVTLFIFAIMLTERE